MAINPPEGFDLSQRIDDRLDDEPASDAELQAVAVLIDADLDDSERAAAFGAMLSIMLSRLEPEQRERFGQIAESGGEAAALAYLQMVTQAADQGRGGVARRSNGPS